MVSTGRARVWRVESPYLRIGRIMLRRRVNAKAAKTAENTLLGKPVHDAFDAIPQPMDVEVDEQTQLLFGQLQVRSELCRVHPCELLDSLDLNDK
jgi:hypothetical protein